MKTNQLNILIAVVENNGITAAAKKLHMTQPAVSVQIKQLEAYFGMPLIEFIGKKIKITDVGYKVYQTAIETQRRLDGLEMEIQELQDCVKGKLSIAIVSTAKYAISKILGKFHHLYPQVDITIKVTNRAEVLERLKNSKDDFVILSQLPDKITITAEKIITDELVIPALPNHPLAKKKIVSLSDLKNEPFIIREIGSGTRMAMEKIFKKRKFKPKIAMELGSDSVIKQAIMAGFGLSVLSKMSLEQEIILKKLIVLNIEGFPITHHWYIVYLKNKYLSPVAKKFLDLLSFI